MENISEKECEEEVIRVRVEQESCSHERGTDADYEEVFFPGHGISRVRSEESDWREAFWQRLRRMAFSVGVVMERQTSDRAALS